MYLISFYVPESHLQDVTTALFNRGAGHIGNYDSCAWYTQGTGQFRPLDGSVPFIGTQDKVEYISEVKVEMVCKSHMITDVIQALVNSHPYEEPAYHAIEILTFDNIRKEKS